MVEEVKSGEEVKKAVEEVKAAEVKAAGWAAVRESRQRKEVTALQ